MDFFEGNVNKYGRLREHIRTDFELYVTGWFNVELCVKN